MKKLNEVNVNVVKQTQTFSVSQRFTFDVTMDITCENHQQALMEGLQKLSEYAVAIPELTLTLHDGTVITPHIDNYSTNDDEELSAMDENEEILFANEVDDKISVEEVEQLISQKNKARKAGELELADEIEEKLIDMGVEIEALPLGTKWRWVK